MADIDWNSLPDASPPAAQPATTNLDTTAPPAVNWDSLPDATSDIISAQKYGTPSQEALTIAEGLPSLATGGLSRQFESAVLNNAKEQKARMEENPGLNTLSEFGGILAAPEIEGVGALVNGVARVGKAVEGIAGPVAAKILGKTLGKVASKAAGSSVEGAFWGLGNEVNENAVGDADLNASSIMHNMGFGALLGGSLGGSLGLIATKFSPEVEKAATKEMQIDNITNTAPSVPTQPPQSMEELKAFNEKMKAAGVETDLPEKSAVIEASKNLVGDLNAIPHGMQIESLTSPVARLEYKMALKDPGEFGQELRKFEYIQKNELSQNLIPKYIQDIAPEEKLASNAIEGGQAAINDFKEQYEANKLAEKDNFDKLDAIQTNSVANPQDILKGIYQDMPKIKSMVGITAEGNFFLRPLDATTGIEPTTYKHFKSIIKALNKDDLTIGDIRDLRSTMLDDAKDWTKGSATRQINDLRSNLMSFMQDQVEKVLPDAKVREFMKRYAINEQNRGIIENIFGGSLDDKATFGRAVEPEKVLSKLFSSVEDVKAAKPLLGDKWNKTVANYLSHLHDIANDPVKGFSSNKFNRSINDVKSYKNLILDEAMSQNPEQLQKIRDASTIMRGLPDSPPGNPSDTASANKIIAIAKKWGSALLHPTTIPGNILSTLGETLDKNAQRSAFDRMMSARAEDNFTNKAQKYNALGTIERMQQKSISTIKNGVSSILDSGAGSGVKGLLVQKLTPEDQQKKFDKISTQLKDVNSSPENLIDKLQTNTKDLYDIAPKLATSLATTMGRAVQFLVSKLPNTEPSSPGTPPYQPSQSELATFNRYYSIVEKPLNILKHVENGTLTPEGMEALQAVHPKLYATMKQEMMDQFLDNKQPVSYKSRLMISMFLNEDLSNSLHPQNIASAQTAGPPPQQMEQPKRSNQKGLAKLKASEHIMTPMQQSSNRQE
jgi:hypothetical protein